MRHARSEPESLTAGDGWAIFAAAPGERDLGCPVLWQRSQERADRRRIQAAARRRTLPRTARGRVSAALVAMTVLTPVAPLGSVADAAPQTGAGSSSVGVLKLGSRGAAVAAAQRALGIEADGVFGQVTERAVRAFQSSQGLVVDGAIGPQTAGALGTSSSSGPVGPVASATRSIQRLLGIPADGIYGSLTRAAVREFQRSHGLVADGIVGPVTLAALEGRGGGGSTRELGVAPPAAGAGVSAAIAAARAKLGASYAWAGNGPSSFDCSGLMVWAFKAAGISLPRTSYDQYGIGAPVTRAHIQAGDLVFFNASGPGASHVGIATGPGSVISATTHGVREHSISDAYWGSHYVGARRL